jgi:predicted nucleic acid-binding protein
MMRIYYLDASAFAKSYLKESGSHWVSELLKQGSQDRFVSAELIGVEVVCAIARAEREKRIGRALRNSLAARAIEATRSMLQLTEISSQILGHASQLALRHALRAYDAIHLATALRILSETLMLDLPAPIFVSADGNLLAAARAQGLATEDPNEHE